MAAVRNLIFISILQIFSTFSHFPWQDLSHFLFLGLCSSSPANKPTATPKRGKRTWTKRKTNSAVAERKRKVDSQEIDTSAKPKIREGDDIVSDSSSTITVQHESDADTDCSAKSTWNVNLDSPLQAEPDKHSPSQIFAARKSTHNSDDEPRTSNNSNKSDLGNSSRRQAPLATNLIMVLNSGHVILEYHMQSLLQENVWLEVQIVNAFLSCLNSDIFTAWNDNEWTQLEAGRCPSEAVKRTPWSSVKYIVVGKHQPGHFVLIVVDVRNRLITYINTICQAYGADDSANRAVDVWNDAVANFLSPHVGSKPFHRKDMKHRYQQDSDSCGVLVCMLAKCIREDTDLMEVRTDQRAVARHRESIWAVLLKNKALNKCSRCGNTKDPKNSGGVVDKWVVCERCGNWFHYSCAKIDYNVADDAVASMHFVCSFCRCSERL